MYLQILSRAGNKAYWIPYENKTHTDLMLEDVLLYGTTCDMVECLVSLVKFCKGDKERSEEDFTKYAEKISKEIFAENK